MKPNEDLPALKRVSFKRPMIPFTTGAAAEVPPDGESAPS